MGTEIGLDLLWLANNKAEMKRQIPVLVFGTDNFHRLSDVGFNCMLVDKRPSVANNNHPRSLFMNKFVAFSVAMDMYDEAVFLDLDCEQTAELPADFWEKHGEKSSFQAPLVGYYRNRGTFWRPEHLSLVSIYGCYVYMRGKEIAKMMMDNCDSMLKQYPDALLDDEIAMDKMIDDLEGGWNGTAAYSKNHMPEYFVGQFRPVGFETNKDVFVHYESPRARKRQLARKGKYPMKYPFVGDAPDVTPREEA